MSTSNLYREDKSKGCTILLVRHPESESNKELHNDPHVPEEILLSHKNPDVTELGKVQIEKTVAHLVSKFSSDKNPAEVLLALTSIQPRASKMGTAFIDELTRSNAKDHLKYFDLVKVPDSYEYRRPGKGEIVIDGHYLKEEPWDLFMNRVLLFKMKLEALVDISDYIVVFGHSIFFSALTHLCTSPGYTPKSVDDLSFHFPNASISSFVYNGNVWSMLYHGNVSHLEENERSGVHTHIY